MSDESKVQYWMKVVMQAKESGDTSGFLELIDDDKEALAEAMSRLTGLPVEQALARLDRAAARTAHEQGNIH